MNIQRFLTYNRYSLVCVLLSIGLAFPSLFFYLHKDASVFLMAGRALVNGQTLYKDLWDIKPPLIYLLAALPASLDYSHQVFGFYALNLVPLAVTAFYLGAIARRYSSAVVGVIAIIVYVTVILTPGGTSLGQCETWANALGLAALWHWTQYQKTRGLDILCGLLLGAIVFLKVTSLLPLIPLLFLEKKSLRSWLLLCLGFGTALLIVVAWLIASSSWEAFIDVQQNFTARYVQIGSGTLNQKILWLLHNISFWTLVTLFPSLLVLFGVINRTVWPPHIKRLLIVSALLSVAAIWIQSRSVVYQWQPLLPAFSLLAASGCIAIIRLTPLAKEKEKWLAVAMLCWGLFANRDFWSNFVFSNNVQSRITTLAQSDYVAEKWQDTLRCSAFLKAQSQPKDKLFVWGFEPILYVYSELAPANRFVYTAGVSATFAPPEWRQETWNSLQQNDVRFIVIQNNMRMTELGSPNQDVSQLWRKTPVFPWFQQNYRFIRKFGSLTVYEKKPAV